jgi:ERCC4-type nuclease
VLRAADGEESAALMLQAARQARAMAAGALPRRGPGSSRRSSHRQRVRNQLLQGLPGVGPTRAERLLERFGTVEKVMAADADDLAAVPGIGPTTAELIRWAVEERPAGYRGA